MLCCRYRQGRGHHTRFQRCWRYGAALDVWAWSLSSEGPELRDALAGGTTSRSCRRTPRVSPLVQFGATLRSPGSRHHTPRCELRAGPLRFARRLAAPPAFPLTVAPSPFYDPSQRALVARRDPTSAPATSALLFDQLKALAKRTAPDVLKQASQPFRDMPEVVIPLYERIVADSPNDAQAMVVLANAYWLTGRGPDAVEQLASRAKQIDPENRGAWHLWALAAVRSCESASIVGTR